MYKYLRRLSIVKEHIWKRLNSYNEIINENLLSKEEDELYEVCVKMCFELFGKEFSRKYECELFDLFCNTLAEHHTEEDFRKIIEERCPYEEDIDEERVI
jgi:hypothetical protein